MSVRIAKSAGFCFGVNRAVELVEQAAKEGKQVCTLGPIIHNRHAVKHFEVTLTEPMGMDSAQVTAGGIVTGEFRPETMESKLVPGLYACGEVLDIDGDCGGYNLQWAWSSGRCAGLNAGKETI